MFILVILLLILVWVLSLIIMFNKENFNPRLYLDPKFQYERYGDVTDYRGNPPIYDDKAPYWKGFYQWRQKDGYPIKPHQYYDPDIRSSMLNDMMASYQPNTDLYNIETGRTNDWLTNYKKYIVARHDEYHKRNRIKRAWWD